MKASTAMIELPASVQWLMPAKARLADFHGRPVVLAFINAASEWCQQRLDELGHWQRSHPGTLQVVIVQVPRFAFEQDGGNTLALLQRVQADAAVALDAGWAAWRQLGITSWPTFLLLDAEGREAGRLVGSSSSLEPALVQLCAKVRPLPVEVQSEQPSTALHAPQGLAISEDRIYVADTGHHQVLECTHDGRILRRFGSGQPDLLDGKERTAAFHRPRGLLLERGMLYVVDAGNHAIRRITLLSGQVDTLVGNGRQGEVVEGPLATPGSSSLNQPTAVALVDNQLIIAQAGDNRLWKLSLGQGGLSPCAGSGTLELRDGSDLMAAFAQPVALVAVQQTAYVCDALSSSVRSVQVRDGAVQTLVGLGLWRHGHMDGTRAQALLQYPQAIAMEANSPWLWIADTGNGALRRLRLGGGDISTMALPEALFGMSAMAALNGQLWITDTCFHRLLRYDPANGQLTEILISE